MGEQSLQHLVPIFGADYAILPEVALRGKNIFRINRYAQNHDLEVLPLTAVNRTARAVKLQEPTEDFRNYARKVDEDLKPDEIDRAYRQLHEHIWNQYWITPKEVLIWSIYPFFHPRVVDGETAELKSTLLKDYRVPAEKDVFDISGIETPMIEVQWPTQGETTIPKSLAELFDADPTTLVYTDTDTIFREGIRVLGVGFSDCERPDLDSVRFPRYGDSDAGSLLGRKIQKK